MGDSIRRLGERLACLMNDAEREHRFVADPGERQVLVGDGYINALLDLTDEDLATIRAARVSRRGA